MPTQKRVPPTQVKDPPAAPTDTRGNVRVYSDLPRAVANELAILAIRSGVSKRALMTMLIMNAVNPPRPLSTTGE